jgi:anti-sigma factor RsiW
VLAPWRWAAVPLAATLAAALSWSVATHQGGSSGENIVLAELVSGHVRSLMADHLVDVATSDQHTVKPWLSSKVDFSPPVPDLAAAGFPLAGGRLDYLDNRAVVALVYHARQHVIDLFVWPEDKTGEVAPRALAKHGYNVLRWTSGGMNYWAISDVNAADLKSFAEAYAAAR